MIVKLWDYFGVVGVGSILLWASALMLLLIYCRSDKRSAAWFAALVLSILGRVAAGISSDQVSAIEIDRSVELQKIAEERKKAQEEALAQQRTKAGNIRFAEDTKTDTLDLAGVKGEAKKTEIENAIEKKPAVPAYKAAGKQVRETKTGPADDDQQKLAGESGASKEPEVGGIVSPEVEVRKLKEPEHAEANQWDRFNLFFARSTLLLSLCLVLFNYIRRFNRTRRGKFPIPLASRWMDSVSPKEYVVDVSRNAADNRLMLEHTVLKGETFILLGDSEFNEWQPRPALSRLRLVRELPFFALPKVTISEEKDFDPELVFESAWFNRYCFVISSAQLSQKVAGELVEFLKRRSRTRAFAFQTVNVLWNFAAPLEVERLHELRQLCPACNFRFWYPLAEHH